MSILEISFEKPVILVGFKQGLRFSDGTTIEAHHEQDCCEEVYADWQQLADTGIYEEEFKHIEICGREGFGISINGKYGVPCYNIQNGYYSDELKLVIKTSDNSKAEIDISNFTESHFN